MPALLSQTEPSVVRTEIQNDKVFQQPAGRPCKHEEYYMPDGTIVIKVENTLFKLDLSVLHKESEILRLIVPPVYSGSTKLLIFSDERPFVLHEVTVTDFVRLLWVIFTSDISPRQPITVEEWLSVLKLATRFQMEAVRSLAAARLHTLPVDPVRKVAIWDEYKLDPNLLISSYVALCLRAEPLTLGMTMSLGLKKFTQVAAARDIYRQRIGHREGCCMNEVGKGKREIAEEIVTMVFATPKINVKHKKPPIRL